MRIIQVVLHWHAYPNIEDREGNASRAENPFVLSPHARLPDSCHVRLANDMARLTGGKEASAQAAPGSSTFPLSAPSITISRLYAVHMPLQAGRFGAGRFVEGHDRRAGPAPRR